MQAFRNIALAAIVASAAAFSTVANAAPIPTLRLGVSAENPITPVYHFGYYGYGYGPRRLCYVPFHRLAEHFGYWKARWIKRRCYLRAYYGHYGYDDHYGKYGGYAKYRNWRKYDRDDD